MKTILYVPVASALAAISLPANAQDDAAEAVADAAVDAVVEAAEAATDAPAQRAPKPVTLPAIEVVPNEPAYPTRPRAKSIWRKIRQADYPPASWVAGEEGYVGFSVTVSATGEATACTVTQSSGFAALDEATCPLIMERVEFSPALAAEDEPIESIYDGEHRWRKREPELPTMAITYQFDQTALGTMTNCKILRMEGDLPERMRKSMERDMERNNGCMEPADRYGTPYRDENGNPVAKRVTFKVDVVVEDVPEE